LEDLEREEDKDLAARPKKEEPKICPLVTLALAVRMHGDDVIDADFRNCIRERCALWVGGHKETIYPDYYLKFEGCGLLSNIFWEKQKRPPSRK